MTKLLSVSIGIAAYNEEANIKNLLLSILAQKEKGFFIKEIIVISDGSTDETAGRVQEILDPRVKLLVFPKRLGKSQHLNKIFQKAEGEIIVLFDADVILASSETLAFLVSPFFDRPKQLALVGGNPQPRRPGQTFIEIAVNVSFLAYDQLRFKLRGGSNPYACDGRILALSQEFARQVKVPADMIANDAFLYFFCLDKGFVFQHVRAAKVWYRSPANLRDHLRQNKRFIASRYRLARIFGSLVGKEYFVPKILMYRLLFQEFLKKPLHSLVILLTNFYCAYYARKEERRMTAKWPIAVSTKEGIAHET